MTGDYPIRINKFLAKCGHGSRRSCESLIEEGVVRVNGEILTDLFYQVNQKDSVLVNRKKCTLPANIVMFAFNKPKNTLCSFTSEGGKPTIYDFIPGKFRKLHYVGRLDFQSHGLLLMTNDGDLTQKLLQPNNQLERVYKVKVKPELSNQHKLLIEKGVKIEPRMTTRPAKITLRKKFFEIQLKEGKNREIRKMMQIFRYKVMDLQRLSFGTVTLGELKLGKMRILSNDELNSLNSSIKPIL